MNTGRPLHCGIENLPTNSYFMTSNEIHDIVIIGSGPAGLTAALYAARAELKPVVLAGLTPGGQLMQTTDVENYPGFPEGIMGPDLMANMIRQVERFTEPLKQESVTSVNFKEQPFSITTEKNTYLARAVIIATGAEANWLGLPNEQRLRGKGVSACATCDGFFFKGKDVVVVGGGDSAMEEANFLTRFANSVTIVHRKEDFRASKIMLKRAQDNPKIKFLTNSEVIDVMGETNVAGIKIKNTVSGNESELEAGGLFLAIGHTPSSKVFKEAGVETDARGYVATHGFTHTNIPGIFMAGDVGDARYRQAVTAAGLGCMAALDAQHYLENLQH